MADLYMPAPVAERLFLAYWVLVAGGGIFLLVVSLKQTAGDFDWLRVASSFAYALFFAGIVMGHWFDRRRGLAVGLIAGEESIGSTIWPRVT